MASETPSFPPVRWDDRLDWFDRRLLGLIVGSLAVTLVAALVQVSFGAFSGAILSTAWAAVFDPKVWTNPHVLLGYVAGDGPARAVVSALGLSTEPVELSDATVVVWSLRLPRVAVGVLVGANLAVSGAIFQAITRNELASPYILGVSSGAGLAVLVTLVLVPALSAFLPLFAAVGGAAAFLLVYAIAWQNGTDPVRLVLAGVIVATVFHSLQTALFFFADDLGVVQQAIAWTTGSLTNVDWEQVRIALPWTAVTLPLALVGARQLNVLLLGERTAGSLGMNVERVRFGLSAVAILAASAAIAVAGIVGFVGLVVPHVVRTLVGSDYKRLVVGCAFAGPALLAAADVGARLAFAVLLGAPTQLPVGVVTGLVGGPYFLYLMRRKDTVGGM